MCTPNLHCTANPYCAPDAYCCAVLPMNCPILMHTDQCVPPGSCPHHWHHPQCPGWCPHCSSPEPSPGPSAWGTHGSRSLQHTAAQPACTNAVKHTCRALSALALGHMYLCCVPIDFMHHFDHSHAAVEATPSFHCFGDRQLPK